MGKFNEIFSCLFCTKYGLCIRLYICVFSFHSLIVWMILLVKIIWIVQSKYIIQLTYFELKFWEDKLLSEKKILYSIVITRWSIPKLLSIPWSAVSRELMMKSTTQSSKHRPDRHGIGRKTDNEVLHNSFRSRM